MGGLSLCLVVSFRLLLKLTLLSEIGFADSLTSLQPSCHGDERSALLQFKESFVIAKSASSYEGAYPKVLDWNTSNCCSWNGIECDEDTGYVVGLDVSSSCLYGSINSNNTLFRLVHLQSLDLADNHFNFSQIPTAISQLSGLTYLNLSFSKFFGQVPIEISYLSKLAFLDLSHNYNATHRFLSLGNFNLSSLLRNLTSLEFLDLDSIDLSSTLPHFLSNFSSLKSLLLRNCKLYGDFPIEVFQLPYLQILDVEYNRNLTGYLPEFHKRSNLTTLSLGRTSFSGSLPSSIEKLDKLVTLSAYESNFSGSIPSSLGKLTQLTNLLLGYNNISGYLPSSLQNLTRLTILYLPVNKISGSIPAWLGNLTKLQRIDLEDNQLHGSIPQSLSKLVNLETLNLHENNLGGTVRFSMFLDMISLIEFQLNSNNLSLLFEKTNASATIPQFKLLGLASCNLNEFPDFLRHQNELEWLSLAGNKIHGQVPEWMMNISVDSLITLFINNNFLTGFHQNPTFLPWVNLRSFYLSHNMVRGSLPFPPPSIMEYEVSNNSLTGEISPLFCNMSSLYNLDLSDNDLGGIIPNCLGNSSTSLTSLSVRNNSFRGVVPQLCWNNKSNLRMIDLSYNQLQGELPRSLSNCMMLESFSVANNQLNDTFPSWLGSLRELKILALHHNEFNGVIGKPKMELEFPKLQVIDLSYNNFSGELPSQYISNWNAMKVINTSDDTYLNVEWNFFLLNNYWVQNNQAYAVTITSKGVEIYYGGILGSFAFIDMSSNRFEGEIPKLFGNLKVLRSLNLSNNMLTGGIPSSLGNLTSLESLDLSQNNLFGEIPQQLKQLGFLARFNVSHNKLSGPIPRGGQFDTFESSSFEGNTGLCSDLVLKKCESSQPSSPVPSSFEEDDGTQSLLKLDWKFVAAGYSSGLVVGVVLGNIVIGKKPRWLLKIFSKASKWGKSWRN